MTRNFSHHDRHINHPLGTVDAAGRLSLGRNDRLLGPSLLCAAATATPARLYTRFLDDPLPPDDWTEVSVVAPIGRYPHLRLTGPALRPLLHQARLEYPVRVRIRVVLEAHQIVLKRVR